MVEIKSFETGLVHLFYQPRIIGHDQVLARDESKRAVGQPEKMKVLLLRCLHACNGQLLDGDKRCIKLSKAGGFSLLGKVAD